MNNYSNLATLSSVKNKTNENTKGGLYRLDSKYPSSK